MRVIGDALQIIEIIYISQYSNRSIRVITPYWDKILKILLRDF